MATPLDLAVQRYKALAHPARLRILAMVKDGELCVCQFTAILELAISTVSTHLSELRRAGLLAARKVGRWVFYRLEDDPEVARLLEVVFAEIGEDRLVRRDASIVRQMRAYPPEDLCAMDVDLERLGIRPEE